MKKNKGGIAVAGTMLVDHIYSISSYPDLGNLVTIDGSEKSVGGCVPNVAIDLKKMDSALAVYAMGRVGKDDDGRFIIDTLESAGVDAEGVRLGADNTGFTDVMSIVGGQRTFFTYAGECKNFGDSDVELDADKISMLHLGYLMLLEKIDGGDAVKLLERARCLGIKTSVDLVSMNAEKFAACIPVLSHVDNLIINEVEAGGLTGITPTAENLYDIAKKLKSYGVKERVIIHMPDRGVCLSDGGFTTVASYKLPKGFIKGTTGAGDAFCAGALLAIHDGASDTEILEFSSAAAVAALSSADAVSGMRSKEEISSLVKDFERQQI